MFILTNLKQEVEMGTTDRFKDAVWVTDDSVVVGGAGGIGSWLTLFLSRIGYSVHLYDNDKFEEHNMGGQFVGRNDIGESKVSVVGKLVRNFGGKTINMYDELYTSEGMKHKYMIAAFDNMEARHIMFDNWFKYNAEMENHDALFIDGRLALEQIQIICVDPSKTKDYREKHLFADSDVEEAACTLKQTSHSAAMIASTMTAFFTNHITNMVNKDNGRQVPYEYEYYIPLNMQDDGISY